MMVNYFHIQRTAFLPKARGVVLCVRQSRRKSPMAVPDSAKHFFN